MRKSTQKFCKSNLLCKVALVIALLAIQAMYSLAGGLSAKTISGQVISATDGEPLIGATVKVQGTQTGVVTDFDGNFKILLSGKRKNQKLKKGE
jgi:hypothetical protein